MSKEIEIDINDCLGNRTILYKHILHDHILIKHGGIGFLVDHIKDTLRNPKVVIKDQFGTLHFYSELSEEQKNIAETGHMYCVVVSNDKGKYRIISTSYPTSSIKKGDTLYVHKKDSKN